MTGNVRGTAASLGWAGLSPFIAAPVALLVWPVRADWIGSALVAYALAILCFLAGAWWGIALLRREAHVLVASNGVVILACLGVVLLPAPGSLGWLALMFPALLAIERMHPMFAPQPRYYARLRLRLSLVASLSLVTTALLLVE